MKSKNAAISIKVSNVESLKENPPGCSHVQINKSSLPQKPTSTISDGLPNYMKPTSSSDARKELLQVILHSSTPADKHRNLKNPKTLNTSKTPSSHVGSRVKSSKTLTRNSSLKPVRPSMKKSSGMGLYPKINVSRATCSWTLKDYKLSKALDLNKGANEAEGTSVMKICPYTYCSLKGHRHEPLPPLKCFLSARRRLLKTQKSMKLKGLSSSFKKRGLGKGHKEVNTGPLTNLDFTTHIEVVNDFFVEINAKPKASEEKTQEDLDKEEVLKEISLKEDDGRTQIHESYLVISFEDDGDQNSNLSMEVAMNFLEYVECDQKVEAGEEDRPQSSLTEGEANVSTIFEETEMDLEEEEGPYPDDITDYSENLDDGWNDTSTTSEKAGVNAGLSHEDEEFAVKGDERPYSTTLNDSFELEENANEEVEDDSSLSRVQLSGSPRGFIEADQDTEEADHIEIEKETLNFTSTVQSKGRCTGRNQKSKNEEETSDTEGSISKSFEEDCIEVNEIVQTKVDISSDTDETSLDETIIKSREEGGPKSRYNIIRRATAEYLEGIKKFNSQGPRSLPVEPDPEAEKVDLRHQMMNERKAAEEWMIDYALQQVVMRLDPARKRKVELLVEAFETVIPLSMCETPLQHATSGFAHSRHIQVCS